MGKKRGSKMALELTILDKMNTVTHEMGQVLIIGNPTSFNSRICVWNCGTVEFRNFLIPDAQKVAVIKKSTSSSDYDLLVYHDMYKPMMDSLIRSFSFDARDAFSEACMSFYRAVSLYKLGKLDEARAGFEDIIKYAPKMYKAKLSKDFIELIDKEK